MKIYLKELCLLLIGITIGYINTSNPLFASTMLDNDTIFIKDTIIIEKIVKETIEKPKVTIPPISKESVLAEIKKQDIPHANIILALSILETGNYTSKLCKTHNNIFGLKKGNSYRRYNNYIECIADYKRLISSRYEGGDYYQFLERIKYAGDPQYTRILRKII